jgi:hypothetical protein
MGDSAEGQLAPAAPAQGLHGLQDLEALSAAEPSVFLRRLPTRETFQWPQAAPTWVIKRYRGDSMTDRWFDRRIGRGGRCAARREFDNLLQLQARGLRVPEPLGWWSRGEHSLLVMEYVPHGGTLRDGLTDSPAGWKVWRSPLLELVLGLHGIGRDSLAGFHRDFYLQHLLITGSPGVLCLIDVGRVRLMRDVRRRWFVKDLAALAHSAPDSLGELARLAWLGRYLDGLLGGLDRAASRQRLLAWARAIHRRQTRMEKHRPRHGESRAGEEG